ncbi:MAG: dihydrolipoyl dehydrogenase [Leptospiraceae bacterium]|nr:dihydrolipoyl dehydrogenase [Leptospiraceae bacterium]MCK6380587.1 dihydrolipoyl dehydrogenase [Leptospiraceae bacterium]NUM40332.1 dihydrolipoyl dehydrogenase [Leptospiraceae bacterium]
MANEFDVVVIGAGPGGYVAAIRAAQLGLNVSIIEKRKTLGGTCLNVGCIPSKALLDSSEEYHKAKHKLKDHGIKTGEVQLDLKTLLERKDKIVSEVCEGVNFLMKKNKIERFHGTGKILSSNSVEVTLEDSKKVTLQTKYIIIATGSSPIDIPGFEIDGKSIVTSDHAINLPKVPKHLIVIGAGVIGLELGSVWGRLGAKVSVIELQTKLFGTADKQMSDYAQRLLTNQGFEFYFGHKVTGKEKKGSEIIVKAENSEKDTIEITGDVVLVAVGRKPYFEGLGAKEIGVRFNSRNRIEIDSNFRTNIPGVYAIGDIVEGPMLAHKAEEEGIAVAEILAGQKSHVNYNACPYIVYVWPEVAWVGLGEEELQSKRIEYKVGKSFFKANGRSKAMNEHDGQVKILADKKTDKILGIYIVGPRASDMIAEAAIALEFGASSEDIARAFHAHPTLSEVVKEAAMSVDKWSIHGG